MSLKYKVGDRVHVVEGGWGISYSDVESLSGEVFEIISYLPDGYFGEDGYLLKPSLLNRFGYVPGEDGFIGGKALQLVEGLQTSNESGYLVQKISVENDVVSSAVNTSDNEPKAQDNSWYENGDLPPVGANIEYKLGAGPWFEATVKYVLDIPDGDEDGVVIACPHLGFEQLLVLDKHTKIRPIQTPEQIAAQERKKVIDAISDVLIETERMSSYTDVAAHLYESGLRFVEEGVE